MIKNLFGLMMLVFGVGAVNIFAQAHQEGPIKKGILNGAAISLPKPVFPAAAKAVRASGSVNVQITIDAEGNVKEAKAVSGHPLLRGAAETAARSAKFKSPTINTNGVIVYNFIPPVSKEEETETDVSQTAQEEQGFTAIGRLNADKSGSVLNNSAINLPKPAFPPAARAVKAQGAVNVQVLIDEDGNVVQAEAVSGHPLLRAAAVNAALGAKFKPTLLEGNPVKVNGIIVYNFVP